VPKKSKTPRKPLYRRPAPGNVASALCAESIEPQARHYNDILHAHPIAPSHFELREDGSIQVGRVTPCAPKLDAELPPAGSGVPALPKLIYQSDTPFIRLYHGNSLELLDAIAAKYPDGRFDAIFTDPPAWP
jgi:hypothetical protein